MKGLGKILIGFSVVTAVLLVYVHERVEMFRISYKIYDRSAQLSKKAEDYRLLKFEVTQLRSPQSLEKRLHAMSLPFTLPKEIKVLRVPSAPVLQAREPLPVHVPTQSLFHFLGQWVQVAQARTDQ